MRHGRRFGVHFAEASAWDKETLSILNGDIEWVRLGKSRSAERRDAPEAFFIRSGKVSLLRIAVKRRCESTQKRSERSEQHTKMLSFPSSSSNGLCTGGTGVVAERPRVSQSAPELLRLRFLRFSNLCRD